MTAHGPVISALLGPREPELDCDACFDLIDEYVDLMVAGEDAPSLHPRMRAHLTGCPVCQEEYESLYTLVREGEAA